MYLIQRLMLFCLQASPLSVSIALESSHGSHTYATAVLEGVDASWRNFRATLTAEATDFNARLALRLEVRLVLFLLYSNLY